MMYNRILFSLAATFFNVLSVHAMDIKKTDKKSSILCTSPKAYKDQKAKIPFIRRSDETMLLFEWISNNQNDAISAAYETWDGTQLERIQWNVKENGFTLLEYAQHKDNRVMVDRLHELKKRPLITQETMDFFYWIAQNEVTNINGCSTWQPEQLKKIQWHFKVMDVTLLEYAKLQYATKKCTMSLLKAAKKIKVLCDDPSKDTRMLFKHVEEGTLFGIEVALALKKRAYLYIDWSLRNEHGFTLMEYAELKKNNQIIDGIKKLQN